jgi:hypothetical protein
VIPRAADMPAHFIGTKSFDLLKVSHADAIPPNEVQLICEALAASAVRRD